jgi:hypothetical protein
MDVLDQCLQIERCNLEITHSQRDEPLQEFPDVPDFPPDPYALLTPAESTAFGIGPARVFDDDGNEE